MKLFNEVQELLEKVKLKDPDRQAEAGDTSFDAGHSHKTQMDKDGNGKTIQTLPGDHEPEHEHPIVDGVVQEVNGHTHEVIS